MPAAVAGPEIERLIQLLARLPGLGPRSRAPRAALHLIKKREQLMRPARRRRFLTAMDKIEVCGTCGFIDTQQSLHGVHRRRAAIPRSS